MIKLRKITKKFKSNVLFQNFTSIIAEGTVIGLFGENGTGKTTLLNIISGDDMPSMGKVLYDKQYRFSKYFPSNELEEDLSSGEKSIKLLNSMLDEDSDVFLLDEPTNHLDHDATANLVSRILELKQKNKIIVIASHNRDFLDSVANKIYYFNGHSSVREFRGNFTKFWETKSKEDVQVKGEYDDILLKVQKLRNNDRKRQDKFSEMKKIKRADPVKVFRKKQKFKHQSTIYKRKILRLLHEDLPTVHKNKEALMLTLGEPMLREENTLISIDKVAKKIRTKKLFDKLSFIVIPGEKILLKGPNGSGKTTLLKMIADTEKDYEGKITRIEGLKVYFFRQEHKDDIDEDKLLKDEIIDFILHEQARSMGIDEVVHHNINDDQILDYLVAFEFDKSYINRSLSEISEGEKIRFRLAKMLLQDYDVILFDEPTNFVDSRVHKSIIDAIKRFRGAMIVATHDESLISAIEWDFMIDLGTNTSKVLT